MCRYSDYYDWYVNFADNGAVSDTPETCEDCWRKIKVGEAHTRFTCMENEDSDCADRYMWVAQAPEHVGLNKWSKLPAFQVGSPYIRISEETFDGFEALGFVVFGDEEDPTYVSEVQTHVSCAQCVIANRWLEKICHQDAVQVTVHDLDSHTDEYHPPMLGADFMRLHRWSQRKWILGTAVVPPAIVEATTERAIAHALAVGLQDE